MIAINYMSMDTTKAQHQYVNNNYNNDNINIYI